MTSDNQVLYTKAAG